eukprot:jgi/Mesen1/9321/ME000061S08767
MTRKSDPPQERQRRQQRQPKLSMTPDVTCRAPENTVQSSGAYKISDRTSPIMTGGTTSGTPKHITLVPPQDQMFPSASSDSPSSLGGGSNGDAVATAAWEQLQPEALVPPEPFDDDEELPPWEPPSGESPLGEVPYGEVPPPPPPPSSLSLVLPSLQSLLSSPPDAASRAAPPGALSLVLEAEYTMVPADESRDSLLVLASVRAPPVPREYRVPVDLVAVLDVSVSMAGEKLRLVQSTMRLVIDTLGDRDRLSLVVFSGAAQRVTRLARMTAGGKEEAKCTLEALAVGEGTSIKAGLQTGLRVLLDRAALNHTCAVFLLSDGQDTGCRRGLMSDTCRTAACCNLRVHTFGFGADHDAAAMHKVANATGGTYCSVESLASVQDELLHSLGGVLSVAAHDASVELEARPGHVIHRVHTSYPCSLRNDRLLARVALGDVFGNEERDIVVELQVARLPMPALAGSAALAPGGTSSGSSDGGGGEDGADVTPLIQGVFTNQAATAASQELHLTRPRDALVLPSKRGEDGAAPSSASPPAPPPPLPPIKFDVQRNRLLASKAMKMAKAQADKGKIGPALLQLEDAAKTIACSRSARERTCLGILADLKFCSAGLEGGEARYKQVGVRRLQSSIERHSRQRMNSTAGHLLGTYGVSALQESFLHSSQARRLLDVAGEEISGRKRHSKLSKFFSCFGSSSN